MKPLKIVIQNFGAIAASEIDLAGVTLAAICGPNGAGKSTAFTIAPMFALFGTTKPGTRADDMVRTGTKEASVTFDFEHQGDTWRVIRTRSTKGSGKTTLELQRRSGEVWTSQSGASIAETQKKIIDLLNLDAETFSSSSMILQGKANEFTSRPAGQRKSILAQILQLEQYENLQEKARLRTSATNLSLEKVKAKIDDIDSRLRNKDVLEFKNTQLSDQKTVIDAKITHQEGELQQAQVAHSALAVKLQQAGEIDQRAKTLWAEVGAKSAERDRQQQRLDSAQKLLDQEPVILAHAAEFEQNRDKITVLKSKKDQQTTLVQEAQRLKSEQEEVGKSLTSVLSDIAHYKQLLADRPRLEKSYKDYLAAQADIEKYDQLQRHDTELRAALHIKQRDLTEAQESFKKDKTAKTLAIDVLKEKAAMLAQADCLDIEKAECKFLADAKAAKAQIPALLQEFSTWLVDQERTINDTLKPAIQAAEKAVHDNGYNEAEHSRLCDLMTSLKPDADQYLQLDGAAEILKTIQAQQVDLEKRLADLSKRVQDMREQYSVLRKELEILPNLESKQQLLEVYMQQKEQLPAAKEIASEAKKSLALLNQEIEKATNQALDLEAEYSQLIGDSKSLEEKAAERVRITQEALKELRDKQTDVITKLGGVQAKLESLAADEEQRKILVEEMEPLSKELSRWQTLVKAFGRDGIPALIIENAVPELERIANDILGQMSGGRNYLKFETQKELKSRSGMAETLDIIVGDWAGERIYETYSGGEQLRIDFAIRFALAELLSRRAGSKIDWLVIDEGFGSQSDEFLPMVIEAVQSVAHRFGMVLVISHVKAVQEAFAQRIEFQPATEEGAPVEVQVA